MAISRQERDTIARRRLPPDDLVIDQINHYLDRTGMTYQDFARRIGYGAITMYVFLSGKYGKRQGRDNSGPIKAASIDFMAAHPVAPASQPLGRMYDTENVRLLRRYFHEALNRGRAYYVEGAPGTQKSFVLESLVAELNVAEICKNGHGRRAYYIYCRRGIRPLDLVKSVAIAMGTGSQGQIDRVLANIRFDLGQRRALLVFDEAQQLNVDCLETVRVLHDRPPHVGLLFAGSHQLERMFKLHALELEQWNSRFYAGKRLPGMSRDEARVAARAELGPDFPDKKIEKLIDAAMTRSLSSSGEQQYISARRLFGTIRDLKEGLNAKSESQS